ncbi:MAG: retropepsin-like aspartic protease [Sphingomonas sp.]
MNRRDVVRALGLGAGAALLPRAAVAQDDVFVARIALLGVRVVIAVTIGGRGPYQFMIDTGAFLSLIDKTLAIELGLRPNGKADVSGAGGTAELDRYEARDVNLGGLRQKFVSFAAHDASGFGPNIRGALAAGLLTEMDGDLDFERGEWRLYPDGRKERPGFVRLASQITHPDRNEVGSAHMFAHATIEGGAIQVPARHRSAGRGAAVLPRGAAQRAVGG